MLWLQKAKAPNPSQVPSPGELPGSTREQEATQYPSVTGQDRHTCTLGQTGGYPWGRHRCSWDRHVRAPGKSSVCLEPASCVHTQDAHFRTYTETLAHMQTQGYACIYTQAPKCTVKCMHIQKHTKIYMYEQQRDTCIQRYTCTQR